MAFGVIWGSSESGHDWLLNSVAKQFTGNSNSTSPKDVLPILVFALPILIAGAVAAIAVKQSGVSTSGGAVYSDKHLVRQQHRIPSLPHSCPQWVHQCLMIFYKGGHMLGDVDRKNVLIIFVIVPLTFFIFNFIQRHMEHLVGMEDEDEIKNKKLMEQANAFGFGALVSLNLQLLPVARYSPLLKLVGWNETRALFFHVWIGRMVVWFSLIHGGMHSYRWVAVRHEPLWNMITIPSGCWGDWDHYEPSCNYGTDCSCYDHFRNMTGYWAGLSLLVIFFSSLNSFRRKFYTIFVRIHIIAGPLCLLAIIFHYPRAIFYMAGGMLYYLASSMPVFVETRLAAWREGRNQKAGVALVSAQAIGSNGGDRPCVSLTLQVSETAMERYRPGQFVKLLAPEISSQPHPFTINQVVAVDGVETNQMRIIFRQTGQFTKRLGQRLLIAHNPHNDEPIPPPLIHLDGFHGGDSRLDQLLRHDSVLIVAAGIGITPYLSLLQNLYACSVRGRDQHDQHYRYQDEEDNTGSDNESTHRPRKSVQLHWICRDRPLIEYVRAEYLDHVVGQVGEYDIQCTIHFTGETPIIEDVEMSPQQRGLILSNNRTNDNADGIVGETASYGSTDSSEEDEDEHMNRDGSFQQFINPESAQPFQSSKFAVGSKSSYGGNVPMFTSFILIGGFGLITIWICCNNWRVGYLVAAVPLLIWCVVISVLLNNIMPDNGDLGSVLRGRSALAGATSTPTTTSRGMNSSYHGLQLGIIDDGGQNTASEDEERPTLSLAADGCSSVNTATTTDTGMVSGEADPSATTASVEVSHGRPFLPNILSEANLDDALLPAIFVCGPVALMQSLRGCIKSRRLLRQPGRCRGRVSMYEEAFEM